MGYTDLTPAASPRELYFIESPNFIAETFLITENG